MSSRPPFSHARRFIEENRGQVAIVMAISTFPILVGIGCAIDYSRELVAHSNLQQATDATALGMVHTAAGISTTQLQMQTASYLVSASNDANAAVESETLNEGKLCLKAQTSLPTTFMRIANINMMSVSSTSCATLGGKTYEIALALDNTASMTASDSKTGRSKLANTVSSSKNFIATVFGGATTSPNAQISIVPFTSAVKVGAQYASASWMDAKGTAGMAFENLPLPAPDASPAPKWTPTSRFDLFTQLGMAWTGCVEERRQPYTLTDTAADPAVPDSLFEPLFAPDEGDTHASSYNNYIPDGKGDCTATPDGAYATALDSSSIYPSGRKFFGDGQGKYCKYKQPITSWSAGPGPNFGCTASLRPIQLLTNSQQSLLSELTAMHAEGNTNILSGFLWAWRTISPNGPFADNNSPRPYNYTNATGAKNEKVIILMTDGMNIWGADDKNQNGGNYTSLGYLQDARAGKLSVTIGNQTSVSYPSIINSRYYVDAALREACANAKAAGVQVYTLAFSTPNATIDGDGLKLLSNCATASTMAYVVKNGDELATAFAEIASQLGSAHLTD